MPFNGSTQSDRLVLDNKYMPGTNIVAMATLLQFGGDEEQAEGAAQGGGHLLIGDLGQTSGQNNEDQAGGHTSQAPGQNN
ncbi:hypothetical protein BGZ83_011569 [Gryganskiella cystojenkinii]|nr:hypothetical protein BGZ83_011569 [Gryganskiella cystojenkinii]